MPTLLLRFPGRRYHATPWGHHVNEGLIEWPPSPWRLLRALLATGHAKRHWPAEGPPAVARRLIEQLASVMPAYRLPAAVGTHSRHYLPLAEFKDGREATTLVFDTWAQVDDGVLAVRWDVTLPPEEHQELAALARELGYLGRSESWVEGKLSDGDAADGFDVLPVDSKPNPGPDWEQVALLAAEPAADYAAWRLGALREARAATGIDPGKAKHSAAEKRRLAAVEPPFPADLIACLQAETGWLRKLGWSQPPGSRKLLYWRRRDSLEAGAPIPRRQVHRSASVEAMLLAIDNASGNSHALPVVARSLPQGELLHRALIANASRLDGHSVVLSGCDAQRKPLATPHLHAHLLHLDLDGDGHLDHVLIWAPMGLDADAQAAIRATRRSYTKGGTAPLRLALVGSGTLDELAQLPTLLGERLSTLFGQAQSPASRWRSLTPFVPPRHLKRNGRNSLHGQICAELESRGLPTLRALTVLDPRTDEAARAARHFKRVRSHGPQPPQDLGLFLDIELEAPAHGPICLGYASHYGLGLFHACG